MRILDLTLIFVLIVTISAAVPALAGDPSPNGGWDAAWSPDGSFIAFTSGPPHGIPNLWVARADGTGMRRLTARGAHEPRWLPDGKTIVFGTVRSGEPSFMSISLNGEAGSEVSVPALPARAQDPVWSSDGSLIAFAVIAKDNSSRDLWFSRASGGGADGLTSKFWVREWAWAPDGSTLAFVVGKAAGTSLWTVTPRDKEMRLLYKGFCSAPAYSPDGRKLAIAVPDVRSGFKIVLIDLEKRIDREVAVQTFDGRKITWSPDGTRLYFASSRKSEPAVWSIGSNRRGLTRVTPEGIPAQGLSLSPDGSRIAFHAMTKDSFSPDLYTCSVSGGGLATLTRSRPSYWSPVWSPDGRKLAFQSDVKRGRQLFVGSSSGRRARAVAQVADLAASEVAWLPDGKSLLVGDSGQLLVVKASGGKDAVKTFPSLKSPARMPRLVGDEVYFVEWLGGDVGISAVKLDGTGKRNLTNKPKESPEPEGDKAKPTDHARREMGVLVASTEFYIAQSMDDQGEIGNPHSGLGLIGPHPDVAKPEATSAVVDAFPAVSPNGKQVAFIRHGQVWLVGSDGSEERQITRFETRADAKRMVSNPSWSPNGDAVIFQSFVNENDSLKLEIWLCSREAGSERLIYSETMDSEYGVFYNDCTNPPAFTPDGRILFTSVSGGEPHVTSIAMDGGDLRELVPMPSSFPALDRAGRKLAYVDLSDSLERIRVMDLETGKVSKPFFRK